MTIRFRAAAPITLIALAMCRRAFAQTTGDLAAYDAFVVSPFGALPPLATDDAGMLPPSQAYSVRYARWRYDINDAIHNNVGGTASFRLGRSTTTLDLSAAYLAASCDCQPWYSTSAGLRTTVFASGPAKRLAVSSHIAAAATIGVAHYTSDPGASAIAAQAALDLGIAFPIAMGTRLALSVFPGYAGGHFVSDDLTDGGRGTTLATALALEFPRGITLDAGEQRYRLAGTPTLYGVGLSWRRR